ncbi:MAG: endonuclease VII domain-containing protein [Patescibacteria group bacterium]
MSAWKSEEQRQHFLAYQRRRKAAFKEKGICPSCTKNPSAEGRVCCIQCLEDKKLNQKFGTAGPHRQLYADLFERQRGLCGICQNPMKRPVLDHCHKTMVVRGLLCSNCNIGLGQFKDKPELLSKAIKYVSENAGIGVSLKRRESDST